MRRGIAPDLARAADAIAARGGTLGRPLHLLVETTSTNDEAKHAAKAGAPHGSTWVAESQRAGRGRQGRAWLSEPGENLLFSVLLRIACPASRVPILSLVAGLAVRDAVARAAPTAAFGIKWPNDVVVPRSEGRLSKVAGILVETSLTGRQVESIVIGVGINVLARSFPDEIASRATSVALQASEPPDRAEILADVLHELDRDVAFCAARGLGPVHARLSAADALVGMRVVSEQGQGTARGIDPEGRLVVELVGAGVAYWGAGEVQLVGEGA
jgi:BirA family biotin operon repressor/biotin-[acetyl-CoA-carboxylase] ligase